MYRPTSFSELPEVVKNLLIINGLLFLGTISLENYGINLTRILALHQIKRKQHICYYIYLHDYSNFKIDQNSVY